MRSAVEREFIIIGKALKVISRRLPDLFASIPEGRQIIDFRNLLTHEYLNVSDRLVWGSIQVDLPTLKAHCRVLLQDLNPC
nr:HepT-like ribonuclease domain-containing protein [Cyanobium sp. PCC 7001]